MAPVNPAPNLAGRRVLLIISGGIAAYKSLELIRLLRKSGGAVTCVLTRSFSSTFTALAHARLRLEA